jgi:hypothetical protein
VRNLWVVVLREGLPTTPHETSGHQRLSNAR